MQVGFDLVEIARIKKAVERAHFIERVFTEAERSYADQVGRVETYAGIFAAKEAASKALGTGFRDFALTDIEVLHDDICAPQLRFYNNAAKLLGKRSAAVSISHDGGFAGAVVILGDKK